jgi:alkylation response protein AidB-like acyl-CoA dehydrogenase
MRSEDERRVEANEPNARWRDAAATLGPGFAERSAEHDAAGTFVARNYVELKEWGVFSAGVPAEFGGGGASHTELCELLRQVAHFCPSTALAMSMHTHLVAAAVWKWLHTGEGEGLLRRVALDHLVLVSTGATDWVNSNGLMQRMEGGYSLTARKVFASGSASADMLITSAPYDDPEEGPVVLHFPVSFDADGVEVTDDWDAHGMRGTGSNTVLLDRVFIPETTVIMRRPQNVWPPALSVVVTVAMPLIMSVYLGLAESAADRARRAASKRPDDPDLQRLVGEMENALLTADLAVSDMIDRARDYEFEAALEHANRTLMCKTVATRAVLATVEKASEAVGGAGFYRRFGLERLLRDARAAHYHPLPENRQLRFTGRVALGLSPVE